MTNEELYKDEAEKIAKKIKRIIQLYTMANRCRALASTATNAI